MKDGCAECGAAFQQCDARYCGGCVATVLETTVDEWIGATANILAVEEGEGMTMRVTFSVPNDFDGCHGVEVVGGDVSDCVRKHIVASRANP